MRAWSWRRSFLDFCGLRGLRGLRGELLSGEPDESVLQVRRVELDVAGAHAGSAQGEEHRVGEIPGPGDDDMLAAALAPRHLAKLAPQPVAERGRGDDPHA